MRKPTWLMTALALSLTACSGSTPGGPDGGTNDDGGTDGGETLQPARATAWIGPDGGELTLDGATLVFQPGALAEETEIVFEHDPEAGPVEALDGLWRIEPVGLILGNAADLTLPLGSAPADTRLAWERHGDFGPGIDLLQTWVDGDTAFVQLWYLGEGHLQPADGKGVVRYRTDIPVFDTVGGPSHADSEAPPARTWRATGGGGTTSGSVEQVGRLERIGPLHLGADRLEVCEPDEYWRLLCVYSSLADRYYKNVGYGSWDNFSPSGVDLELDLDNLVPLSPETEFWVTSDRVTVSFDPTLGSDLIDGGAELGATSAIFTHMVQGATDPSLGDRTWVYELTPVEGRVPYKRLTGYQELISLAIPMSGTAAATATLEAAPAADTFIFQIDVPAWERRIPGVSDLTTGVYVYDTWGRYRPWKERGMILGSVVARTGDLGQPTSLILPAPPVAGLSEYLEMHVDAPGSPLGVRWYVPRSLAAGGFLPGPPVGLPRGITLNGAAEGEVVNSVADGLTLAWDPAPADGPVAYSTTCRFHTEGEVLKVFQISSRPELSVPAERLSGLAGTGSAQCLVYAVANLLQPPQLNAGDGNGSVLVRYPLSL